MARTPIVDPIAQRIRERRTELGLSLAQASTRAGLKAPSFLHHIERGERLPSEQVVTWLAAALQDDEELLRAWVRLRRGAPLDLALAAAKLLERHLASGDLRSLTVESTHSTNGATATNGDGAAPSPAPATVPESLDGRAPMLLRVPRLDWGTDPNSSEPAPETLRFDPQSLPQEAWVRPFAYRLPAGVQHPAPLKAEDLVLLTRNAWPLSPRTIYLVRAPEGIRLSRVAWRNGTLWLASERLGAPHPLEPSGTPPRDLLARVATVIRAGTISQDS
jgi:transcriptional regulator with XRE-family HTH domain